MAGEMPILHRRKNSSASDVRALRLWTSDSRCLLIHREFTSQLTSSEVRLAYRALAGA